MDPHTNKIVWQDKMPYSIGQGSGSLATAGGLLFHGEPDGNVQAYDAKTGDALWQWQTGAGADAPAITYEVDGVQYVAIASGGVSIQTSSANGDWSGRFRSRATPLITSRNSRRLILRHRRSASTSQDCSKARCRSSRPMRSR